MKARFNFAAVMLMCCSILSCNKAQIDAPEPVEPDFYTVSLGWSGEILEVTDEPLRRGNDQDNVYGIQVYSTPNKEAAEGTNVTWTPYAYSLFDIGDDISINLMKGYRYKFVASMVVDGKNRLVSTTMDGNIAFLGPFAISGSGSSWCSMTNKFDYQSAVYLYGLDKGSSALEKTEVINQGIYAVPNLERFYGEYLDYIPGLKNNEKVMIKMKRTSFGAKFIAKGKLAKEGQLEVQITDAPKIMLDLSVSEKSTSDIYTFKNVKAAYEDNTYKETIPVTINWHKPDGTIFPLGTHEITYKRNAMTTVTIAIETDHADNGLGIEVDDTDMSDDTDSTLIQDGEVVETEIDTNA